LTASSLTKLSQSFGIDNPKKTLELAWFFIRQGWLRPTLKLRFKNTLKLKSHSSYLIFIYSAGLASPSLTKLRFDNTIK